MWDGGDSRCPSLGAMEGWATGCTLAPFMDPETTGGRMIRVESNGFSLKPLRGDAHRAIEHVDLELRSEV